LKRGGVILYPTDTVWGLGCDATNQDAVELIYKIKQRFDNQKMIVLVDSDAMIERYVDDVPEVAYQLLELADTPTTLILENARGLAKNLLGDANSVGIRITREPFTRKLIQMFRKPIVSTSANIHSRPTPLTFSHVEEDVVSRVDYVVNYRQDDCLECKPSSIILIRPNGEFKIIRR
jgi:L-threonylcarbamoyladenylate synthase